MSKEQTTEDRFLFTPENLLENLHKLGPWSAYGLASVALQHYFPDEYDEDGNQIGGTEMLCTKRNVQMYSFKYEKNIRKPENALDGLERMPLECDLYEYSHRYEE